MGYDQHQPSNSSGPVIAIFVVVLLFAIMGVFAVGGLGLFWVRSSPLQMQQRAEVAERRAMDEALPAEALARLEPPTATMPIPQLNFVVELDAEGRMTVAGERIGLDELKSQLVKLKEETSNTFSVRFHADSECPIKHVAPALTVCDEVGDVDYRVTASK